MSNVKTYQIDCGIVHGYIRARSAGAGFRRLMRQNSWTRQSWGELARFRLVTIGHGQRIFSESPWFYQDPAVLMKE